VSFSDEQEVERELAALSSRPAQQRAQLLIELGWSGIKGPLSGLQPFLDDPELLVRIAAVHAWWRTGGEQGEAEELTRLVEILVEGLTGDDEDLYLTAGTILVSMGTAAEPPLIRCFKDRGEKDSRIVRVLGELAGTEARALLQRAARSAIEEVAAEAQDALTAIQEDR
jgi:hypothetical protein